MNIDTLRDHLGSFKFVHHLFVSYGLTSFYIGFSFYRNVCTYSSNTFCKKKTEAKISPDIIQIRRKGHFFGVGYNDLSVLNVLIFSKQRNVQINHTPQNIKDQKPKHIMGILGKSIQFSSLVDV